MENNNETFAEIVDDYRHDADAMDRRDLYQPTTLYLRKALDRLDAAHKLEVQAATTEKSSAVCNGAKSREALKRIVEMINILGTVDEDDPLDIILNLCEEALAAPARNCDVGTADDWMARFSVVCERCSGSDCDHRLFKDEEVCDCFARWAQMPYESEVANGKR